jgi:hypothetical protein
VDLARGEGDAAPRGVNEQRSVVVDPASGAGSALPGDLRADQGIAGAPGGQDLRRRCVDQLAQPLADPAEEHLERRGWGSRRGRQ